MKIGWGDLFTIALAIILAELVLRHFLKGPSNPSKEAKQVAEPTTVSDYISQHYG